MKKVGTFLLLLLAINLATSQITVPIRKRIPKSENESNSFLDDPDQIAITKLINHSLEMYSGDIQLGFSQQSFTVDFDSGSNLLWLTSKNCPSCVKDGFKNSYDCLASDGCNLTNIPAQVSYGGGNSVKGHIARIPVSISGKGPVTESLLLVEQSVNNEGLESDGLMGLGVYDQNDPNSVAFVNKLFQSGFIPKSQFSFYLGFGENDSELVVGGFDSTKLANPSELYYHPIILTGQHNDNQRWRVAFKSVSFGNQSLSLTSQNTGIIDSGTTLAYIRTDVYNNWIKYLKTLTTLKTVTAEGESFQAVKCGTTLPDLVFTLTDVNGVDRDYALPSSFYILKQDNTCVIGILGRTISQDIQFLMGDVFMRRFVSVFDYTNLSMGLSVSVAVPPSVTNETVIKLNISALILSMVSIAGIVFLAFRALRK